MVGFGVRGRDRHSGPGVSEGRVEPARREQAIKAYDQAPLQFETNRGQTDARVKFISRNSGHTLFLTANEAVLSLRGAGQGMRRQSESAVVKMKLAGANSEPRVVGLDELPGRSNYFLGDDPRRWRTNVANYARVEYDEVYPGIDLVWHGAQRRLEHDFIVAPGADPRRIQLSFAGAQTVRVDEQGELVLQTAAGEMRLLKPQAWQEAPGERRPVACEYAINAERQVGFRIGAYDDRKELVIDPVLLYSSYLGGSGAEQGLGIALDKDGNIYVIGTAFNSDFPGPSPIQTAAGQGADVFIVKLNPSGSTILYGTWLGGASEDIPAGIAVDQDGAVYVTGQTSSNNFPVTNGSLQSQSGGLIDAFVAKINPAGSALIYSSYLGGSGSDAGTGIVVDGGGNVYLAGVTDSFNLPATGFQTNRASSGAFKTSDRAANWNSIGVALPTTQIRVIAVDPSNSNTLYAGGFSSLFKSADGGAQWPAIPGQPKRG